MHMNTTIALRRTSTPTAPMREQQRREHQVVRRGHRFTSSSGLRARRPRPRVERVSVHGVASGDRRGCGDRRRDRRSRLGDRSISSESDSGATEPSGSRAGVATESAVAKTPGPGSGEIRSVHRGTAACTSCPLALALSLRCPADVGQHHRADRGGDQQRRGQLEREQVVGEQQPADRCRRCRPPSAGAGLQPDRPVHRAQRRARSAGDQQTGEADAEHRRPRAAARGAPRPPSRERPARPASARTGTAS